MKKQTSYYWFITIMLLFATALSFLDRQVLSISIIKIIEDLGITDTEYGFIKSVFLISYAIMFTLGGVLIDRFGSRWGLGISVGFWSIATALHGIASGTVHFALFRFLPEIGEGSCFPGAVKAVIEWVPKKKQAFANGIAIGAMVALPACACLFLIFYMALSFPFCRNYRINLDIRSVSHYSKKIRKICSRLHFNNFNVTVGAF